MRAEDSDILLALYRSAQDVPAWAGFLNALAARTGAKTAHLVLQGEGQIAQGFGTGDLPLPPETLARMRYLRPYSGDDFATPYPFRALRTRVEGGGEAWVIVARTGDDFAAATSVLLGGLAPHMALSAAQFWRRARSRAAQSAAQDMAARLGLAWALLGANAQPILASEALPSPHISGGRLRLPAPILRQIDQRVAQFAHGKATAPLALSFDGAQALLLPFSGHGVEAILYLQTAKPAPENAANLLADLFALTPAEARFAAEMASGKTIAQAGEALNFTLETARFYSKQIYAKLGAAGQPDAIRRFTSSVYRLG